MGFRCPICQADFKRDKKAWEKHCYKAHKGAARDLVDLVKETVEGTMKEVDRLLRERRKR